MPTLRRRKTVPNTTKDDLYQNASTRSRDSGIYEKLCSKNKLESKLSEQSTAGSHILEESASEHSEDDDDSGESDFRNIIINLGSVNDNVEEVDDQSYKHISAAFQQLCTRTKDMVDFINADNRDKILKEDITEPVKERNRVTFQEPKDFSAESSESPSNSHLPQCNPHPPPSNPHPPLSKTGDFVLSDGKSKCCSPIPEESSDETLSELTEVLRNQGLNITLTSTKCVQL